MFPTLHIIYYLVKVMYLCLYSTLTSGLPVVYRDVSSAIILQILTTHSTFALLPVLRAGAIDLISERSPTYANIAYRYSKFRKALAIFKGVFSENTVLIANSLSNISRWDVYICAKVLQNSQEILSGT